METMANHERLIPDLALCWVVLDGNRQCSRRAYGQPFCRQHNAKFTDAGRDAAKAHREQVKAERDREYRERAAAREAEQRANCSHRYTTRDDGICMVCGTAVAANAKRLAEQGAETLPAIVTCPDCGGYKECGAARCPDCHRKRKAAVV